MVTITVLPAPKWAPLADAAVKLGTTMRVLRRAAERGECRSQKRRGVLWIDLETAAGRAKVSEAWKRFSAEGSRR